MRRWCWLLGLLLVTAPKLGAQALMPSRFSLPAPVVAGDAPELLPGPRICSASKRSTVIRGAVTGFLLVAGATFVVVLVRGVMRVATFRSGMQDVPVLELAAGGAVLFAVLEGMEWERQCG
ncbi:MAG: hypothetical protein IT357_06865 [Gemmatimonadaceae bacterium]|nr:hypothetical protein [Gemmatimonadaceae bacterium]